MGEGVWEENQGALAGEASLGEGHVSPTGLWAPREQSSAHPLHFPSITSGLAHGRGLAGRGVGGACSVRQGLLRSAARVKSDKLVLLILSVRTQKTQWAPGLRQLTRLPHAVQPHHEAPLVRGVQVDV